MHSNILPLTMNRGPYLCDFALKRRNTKSTVATFFLVLSIYADTLKSLGKEEHTGNFLSQYPWRRICCTPPSAFISLQGLKIEIERLRMLKGSLVNMAKLFFNHLVLSFLLYLLLRTQLEAVTTWNILLYKIWIICYLQLLPGSSMYKLRRKMDLRTKLRSNDNY